MGSKNVHVVIFASPGMGHIIPLIEFSRKLVLNHRHCFATIIIPSLGPPPPAQIELLKTLPPPVTHVLLPPVDPATLSHVSTDAKLFLTVDHSMPHLRDVIRSLSDKFPLSALIADIFGTDAFDVAREFKLESYFFVPSNVLTLALCNYMPKLDADVQGDYRQLTEPIRLPGCRFVFPVEDLHPSILDRNSDAYPMLLRHSKRQRLADGFIVNSFMEVEGEIIEALRGEEFANGRPIFPIGPILQSTAANSSSGPTDECLEWLDKQPTSSVLFVSFGSGGTLSPAQLDELAFGLETSGKRFLWVVRSPNTSTDTNASYIGPQSKSSPLSFLPEAFLERTKGQGLAVASWAPQIEVLSHRATGGFLNHCGWNSTMESIVNGVPLIAWPLHGDQKMVAVQLVEFLKIALRPEVKESGKRIIGREEIAKVVSDLMEGEEGAAVRRRMSELRKAALNAQVSVDGSLEQLVLRWRKNPVE
uniref:UDP-glycosyltransferase 1 n=1 Tax=Linum usitatissimum TaxID=4006 RepID=I2BH30_LINUS|nr:UDP-glycosyltransferase 1 [Linum usitatissimum]